jgi:hypothetical protein
MTPSTVAALVVLSVLAAGGVLFYAILIFVLLARMELRHVFKRLTMIILCSTLPCITVVIASATHC